MSLDLTTGSIYVKIGDMEKQIASLQTNLASVIDVIVDLQRVIHGLMQQTNKEAKASTNQAVTDCGEGEG